MKYESLELPKGQSFNEYLQSVFIRDRQQEEEGAYLIEPKVDRLDMPFNLWRFQKGSKRFYYEPNDEVFMPSQTTVMMCSLANDNFLSDWKVRMALLMDNEDAPNLYRDERAEYGNLMHILFTEALIFGGIDLGSIWDIIELYRDTRELWHLDVRKWKDELVKDVSAFFQFIHDHKVVPIAVEMPIPYPIFDENGNIILWCAGAVDLVAEITVRRKGHWGAKYKSGKNKGKPKETYKDVTEIAVIDYKSGKKGFYKGHAIQVGQYMQGWNNVCQRLGVEYTATSCWNFAPKDSRGDEATYSFKEQTDFEGWKYMPHLVRLFMLDKHHEVNDVREVTGKLEFGKSVSDNVQLIEPAEYMKQHYKQKQEEQQDAGNQSLHSLDGSEDSDASESADSK